MTSKAYLMSQYYPWVDDLFDGLGAGKTVLPWVDEGPRSRSSSEEPDFTVVEPYQLSGSTLSL